MAVRAAVSGPGAAARTTVVERDNATCRRCGHSLLSAWRHIHHRRGRAQGGLHCLANLVLLCARCHKWAHEHPRSARAEGWIVGRGQDPAQVPVLDPLLGWIVFDDEGGWNLYDAQV